METVKKKAKTQRFRIVQKGKPLPTMMYIVEVARFEDVTNESSFERGKPTHREWAFVDIELMIEDTGEPVNWLGGNKFQRLNGEELIADNYVPYKSD